MKMTLIGATLNEIDAAKVIVKQIDRKFFDEIIIVDGGSTDGTPEFLRKNGIFVLKQKSKGYGAAYKEALKIAKGDIIIEFTADGSVIFDRVPELVKKLESGYDLVIVSRYAGGAKSYDDTLITAMGNHIFTFIINMLFGTAYTDTLVGVRGYRRKAYEKIRHKVYSNGLSWPKLNAIQFAANGFKVGEIPGDEPKRIGGKRKMRIFGTGWELLRLIIRDYMGIRRERKRNKKRLAGH